jgi:hypothetical protein
VYAFYLFDPLDVIIFKCFMRLTGYDPTMACLTLSIASENVLNYQMIPKIFILNARPYINASIVESWFPLRPIYLKVNYSLAVEDLQHLPTEVGLNWFVNLSLTYINLLSFLLNRYPTSDSFIIIEDDVILAASPERFIEEVACAKYLSLPFYSLYDEKRPTSNEYNFGTQAFYITRSFTHTLLRELGLYLGRKPIDLILSEHNKLYKTRKPLVKHMGSRLHLSLIRKPLSEVF